VLDTSSRPLKGTEDAAARLLHDAMARCGRLDTMREGIAAEDMVSAELRPDIEALQREVEQFRGWIDNGSQEAGEAYRLSKALCEEQDRRVALEDEVFTLRGKLASISTSVRAIAQQQAAQDASESAIESRAADALAQLQVLRTAVEPTHPEW